MREQLRDSADRVFGKIKKHGLAATLQEYPTIKERHEKLLELFPEIKNFLIIARHQLYFHLQQKLGVELGVCLNYSVDDHRQHCSITGGLAECAIPERFCILRDKKEPLKIQEPVLALN